MGENSKYAEIAFFGGSFTAIDREYMLSLLEVAKQFEGIFGGIRISTRPDCIDKEILDILSEYKVTSIELGAQSMCDDVLAINERGHTAEDVFKASELIKSYGFSLGLQMMTGLYSSDVEKDIYTAKQFILIKPDTVRIYPTVIMKNTELEKFYLEGKFVPYTLEESIELCSKLIMMFETADINIIRLGLHYSDSLIKNGYCQNYHPAFKELCESKLFYNSFLEQTKDVKNKKLVVYINRKSLSKFYGQKKCNMIAFSEMGYEIEIKFDDRLGKYGLRIGVSV